MLNPLPLGLQVDPKSEAVVEMLSKLESYDFGGIARDCERKLGWSSEHAQKMMLECKQFLALAVLDPEYFHAPGRDADEFWHRAILHTQWYSAMCQDVFGVFLHHAPLQAINDDQKVYRSRTPNVLAYWFGKDRYGLHYELLGTCQQCNVAIVPVRPHEEARFKAIA